MVENQLLVVSSAKLPDTRETAHCPRRDAENTLLGFGRGGVGTN